MIRIIVADDHHLIREGFKKTINREIDMEVVYSAENGEELLTSIQKVESDVIVLDINMPGRSGLDLIKDIRALAPDTKILILSMYSEDRFAVRALKNGASGYITKESAPEEMVNAIRKVHDRGKYVSQSLAEKLAFNLDSSADQPLHERLSDREFQVFQLIGNGKTMNDITAALNLSLSTVTTYRTRILEKMNFKSNAEIIHYAIKSGLVD